MLTFIHLTALTLAASVSTMLTEHTPVKYSLHSATEMTPTYTAGYHSTTSKDMTPDVTDDAKAGTDNTKDITADDIAKDATADAIADPVDKSKDAAKVDTDGTVGATDGTDTKEGSDGTDAKEESNDVNVLVDGSNGGDDTAKSSDDASSS